MEATDRNTCSNYAGCFWDGIQPTSIRLDWEKVSCWEGLMMMKSIARMLRRRSKNLEILEKFTAANNTLNLKKIKNHRATKVACLRSILSVAESINQFVTHANHLLQKFYGHSLK
jgi:hypothetical protein